MDYDWRSKKILPALSSKIKYILYLSADYADFRREFFLFPLTGWSLILFRFTSVFISSLRFGFYSANTFQGKKDFSVFNKHDIRRIYFIYLPP